MYERRAEQHIEHAPIKLVAFEAQKGYFTSLVITIENIFNVGYKIEIIIIWSKKFTSFFLEAEIWRADFCLLSLFT